MNNGLPRTILVCGAPGVGKSYLIHEAHEGLAHIDCWEADELLSDPQYNLGAATVPDFPQDRSIVAFYLLVAVFEARLAHSPGSPTILLEMRSVIESPTSLRAMPSQLVSRLRPIGLVHVEDDCERIQDRCIADRSRLRLSRSMIQLARYQDRSLRACEEYAQRLGCAIERVRSGDIARFISAVRSLTATCAEAAC